MQQATSKSGRKRKTTASGMLWRRDGRPEVGGRRERRNFWILDFELQESFARRRRTAARSFIQNLKSLSLISTPASPAPRVGIVPTPRTKKTRTSNFQLPTPHRTGRKREHRTSNAELPTSNGRKSKRERKRLQSVPFASYVRRWTFDVQCSTFVSIFGCEVFVFILQMRGVPLIFHSKSFASSHPGGQVGRQLIFSSESISSPYRCCVQTPPHDHRGQQGGDYQSREP